MSKPVLLDLYCGAGGCSQGYADAGFEILGVDHKAQQNYPFEFIKMDALRALEWLDLRKIDAIHASPPCQAHSVMRYRHEDRPEGAELLGLTRELLKGTGKPWIIENVVGAPLRNPTTLCGSMFDLGVRRHRLFECNFPVRRLECKHELQTPRFKNPDSRGPALTGVVNVYGSLTYAGEKFVREKAMQINWMTNKELTQAVPPAYTQYVGEQLRQRPVMRGLWGSN